MDTREQSIQDRVARIKADILDLKKTQIAGGDSWVVYREGGSFIAQPGTRYQIDFLPETEGNFVYQIWRNDGGVGRMMSFYPDPRQYGRSYFVENIVGAVNVNYLIYSTKKGIVTVTPLSSTA